MDLVLALIGATLVFALVVFLLRYVYGYRIREGYLEIVLFNVLPVYRFLLSDIKSVEIVSWKQLGVGGMTLRAGNRLCKESILIVKKRGLFRRVVITPERPSDFLDKIRAKVTERNRMFDLPPLSRTKRS